jgi:hypothetical protein
MQPGRRSQAPTAQKHNKILGGLTMTITMSYEEYNRMQEFAKQFVAKKGGTRPILEYIKLTFVGDTAKAEALDGYKAGYITLSINDCKAEGEMLLPITSKLKNLMYSPLLQIWAKKSRYGRQQERVYTENPKENFSIRLKFIHKTNPPKFLDLTRSIIGCSKSI